VNVGCADIRPAEEDKLPRMVMKGYCKLVRVLRIDLADTFSRNTGVERGNEKEKSVVIADHSFINNILKNGDFPNRLADLCG
jgi:hypothetical protein